jgi:hypothetical protein
VIRHAHEIYLFWQSFIVWGFEIPEVGPGRGFLELLLPVGFEINRVDLNQQKVRLEGIGFEHVFDQAGSFVRNPTVDFIARAIWVGQVQLLAVSPKHCLERTHECWLQLTVVSVPKGIANGQLESAFSPIRFRARGR